VRRRLLLILVVFALGAVAAFAVPLLRSTAAQRTQQLVISRTADLDWFAALAQQAIDSHDDRALTAAARRYTALYGEAVVVVTAHRTPLVQTGGVTAADVRGLVAAAIRNQPLPAPTTIRPWSQDPMLFARSVGTATRVTGAVVLRASVAAAAADVAARWSMVGAGALGAGLVFVLLAILLARWVLRPLNELSEGVTAVAAGREARVPAGRGPRELRSLATSFNRMSEAVLSATRQQRELIADASHHLRNPMAALRLRVDSLAPRIDTDGRRAYHAAIGELERLEALLDGLLALAMADSTATRLAAGGHQDDPGDLVSVLAERVDSWTAAADKAGVLLRPVSGHPEPVLVRCPEQELAQTLDVLLDNAIRYAGENATVTAGWRLRDGHAVLTVSDDGPGLPEDELALATGRFWRARRPDGPRGTGLGLAIASGHVSAHGGSLELCPARPHGLQVRVRLPRSVPAGGDAS
jgi:signal transduction histidine kinase